MEHLVNIFVALGSVIVTGAGAYFLLVPKLMSREEHRKICMGQREEFSRQITEVNHRLDRTDKQMALDFNEVKSNIKDVSSKIDRLIERMIKPVGGN